MNIEYLSEARYSDFIDFCIKYRNEIDDSFLYEEDLKNFQPDEDNPTYIVLNDQSKIIAAVSLIKDSYFRRGKKGRFRIFHSVEPNLNIYKLMLQSIKSHTTEIDQVFLFIQEDNLVVRDIFHFMQFNIERYAYFLTREDMDVAQPNLPNDYSFKNFQFNKDEEVYLYVRNTGFAILRGSETPLTVEEVKNMENKADYLEGGIFLLYHQEKPIGVVRSSRDFYNNESVLNIGPLALIPEYQGKGLGRQLLRKALEFGKNTGLPKAVLSANADNERAVHLYTKEGFKKEESVVCYNYKL
ncbi:GNAT family N-acetyltransferase [Bacillus sp. DTU_2020_1000418_1_SI_GHA_SEK_038]|uniref:GNAT family N-acetyltransferase n=1 Tax=Bacillus sp. DTU_2020_1000418_1_SI_GHA_SEK_038 TaxID=3077585 RepID=UPI0028E49293|nr:GNAT family N-acetyltransferase [Bacillus sp. DTU_2020_1000418_1_SI_GHA_SEK_038]WNS76190.1 GNAT family N-acetyltransferase [Bacillus sp. DTU_2020_1000418_1_SI_GHA_SEK_038]